MMPLFLGLLFLRHWDGKWYEYVALIILVGYEWYSISKAKTEQFGERLEELQALHTEAVRVQDALAAIRAHLHDIEDQIEEIQPH